MPVRHLFVYGTLRRGEARDINRLSPAPRWVGTGSVTGRLFDLGSYPGLRLGGDEVVTGEVYAITPVLERLLDEIEEVWPTPNGEYDKRDTTVSLEIETPVLDGGAAAEITCLVYEASHSAVCGRPLIEGGDWVAFRTRDSPVV
jgi:gamma-glutamylcyclotransferase (GGCT)/AIG2-like uncharacterized protein YtfP